MKNPERSSKPPINQQLNSENVIKSSGIIAIEPSDDLFTIIKKERWNKIIRNSRPKNPELHTSHHNK